MALPQLFNHLNLSLFLKVFGSILEERKILLLSTSLRLVEELKFDIFLTTLTLSLFTAQFMKNIKNN